MTTLSLPRRVCGVAAAVALVAIPTTVAHADTGPESVTIPAASTTPWALPKAAFTAVLGHKAGRVAPAASECVRPPGGECVSLGSRSQVRGITVMSTLYTLTPGTATIASITAKKSLRALRRPTDTLQSMTDITGYTKGPGGGTVRGWSVSLAAQQFAPFATAVAATSSLRRHGMYIEASCSGPVQEYLTPDVPALPDKPTRALTACAARLAAGHATYVKGRERQLRVQYAYRDLAARGQDLSENTITERSLLNSIPITRSFMPLLGDTPEQVQRILTGMPDVTAAVASGASPCLTLTSRVSPATTAHLLYPTEGIGIRARVLALGPCP